MNLKELKEQINEAKDTFDEKWYIGQYYHMFFQAVQQGAEKAHLFATEEDWINAGRPIWNQKDTIQDWLKASLKEIVDYRIPEIKAKKKKRLDLSSFQKNIINLAEGTRNDDRLVLVDEDELEPMDKLFYEYMEWALFKQKETITRYLKGKFELTEEQLAMLELQNSFEEQFGESYLGDEPKSSIIKPGVDGTRKVSDLMKMTDLEIKNN